MELKLITIVFKSFIKSIIQHKTKYSLFPKKSKAKIGNKIASKIYLKMINNQFCTHLHPIINSELMECSQSYTLRNVMDVTSFIIKQE